METESKLSPLFLEANIRDNLVVTYQWERNPRTGVDQFEHNMTILDSFADLEARVYRESAQRVTEWHCGKDAFATLESIPQTTRKFVLNDRWRSDYIMAVLGDKDEVQHTV